MRIIWQTVRRITDEILGVKGLNPKRDYRLISPYSFSVESFIKFMRIREMMNNQKSFDC